MSKKGFVPQGFWINLLAPIINENYICRERDQTNDLNFNIDTYNPFDYYHSAIDHNIVKKILVRTCQPFKIHVLFASLDPSDDSQIIRWCKYFGLPTYCIDTDELFSHYWGDQFQPVQSLEATKLQIKNYKLATHISALLTKSTTTLNDLLNIIDDVINLLGQDNEYGNDIHSDIAQCHNCYLFYAPLQHCPYCGTPTTWTHQIREVQIENKFFSKAALQELIAVDWHTPLQEILDKMINDNLIGISPIAQRENQFLNIRWNFDTLLSALYLMLAMDIAANHIPLPCQNPRCSNFFIPYCETASYCSPECQNRAKQQRHRAKIKKQKVGE